MSVKLETNGFARELHDYLAEEDPAWRPRDAEHDYEALCEMALEELNRRDDTIRRLRQRTEKLAWIIKGAAELLIAE